MSDKPMTAFEKMEELKLEHLMMWSPDPLQDGLLQYYLACVPFSDNTIEKRVASETFDYRSMPHYRRP